MTPEEHIEGSPPVELTDIYPLDPKDIPLEGTIAVVGRSKSGKSTIARSLLKHLRHRFDSCIVICASKKDAKKWERHVPATFVFTEFDSDMLLNVLAECEQAEDMGQPHRCVIFLDDSLYRSNTRYLMVIDDLCCRGRQANILTVMMLHDPMKLSPTMRGQILLVFLCFEANMQHRLRLHEAFNPVFKNFEKYDEALRACTQQFSTLCLFMENRQSYDVSEYAYWYKAKWPEPAFVFNRRSYQWEYHRKYYDPNYRMKRYAKTEKQQKRHNTWGDVMPPNQPPRYTSSGTIVYGPFEPRSNRKSTARSVLRIHPQQKHSTERLRIY